MFRLRTGLAKRNSAKLGSLCCKGEKSLSGSAHQFRIECIDLEFLLSKAQRKPERNSLLCHRRVPASFKQAKQKVKVSKTAALYHPRGVGQVATGEKSLEERKPHSLGTMQAAPGQCSPNPCGGVTRKQSAFAC